MAKYNSHSEQENVNDIPFLPPFLSRIWLVSPKISCTSPSSLFLPLRLTDSNHFQIPSDADMVEPHTCALFPPPTQSLAGGTGTEDT